ncbi:hypothetical protein BS329_22375 [Amycolatopsis coloradensis]|uniref:Uncharacterized protein n=1 Tax=Amycolatopsis coloradensis TaxID=76021 RepID=A0A1R0KPV3_9PSEU|nr:hypothetical protein BS329_22375 [Amycolatopsis coloradensis]
MKASFLAPEYRKGAFTYFSRVLRRRSAERPAASPSPGASCRAKRAREPLLGGSLELDGGWLLDGGLVGVVVGGRQTISNSTVAVPLAAGRFGPLSQGRLALMAAALDAQPTLRDRCPEGHLQDAQRLKVAFKAAGTRPDPPARPQVEDYLRWATVPPPPVCGAPTGIFGT